MASPMYNVFVGSETGLLKGINVANDHWKNLNEVEKADKSNEIRSLSWIDEEETGICVGLRNQNVGIFDIAKQSFTSVSFYDGGPGDLRDAIKIDDLTVTALDTGFVNIWQDDNILHKINTVSKKGGLSCMTFSDFDKNVFGTGGKDSNLKIWNLNNTEKPLFHAKNVRNDWLNLEVPIWITGIGFLSDKYIVTSTGYHQVRVYSPDTQRRPVLDMSWDEYPITAMSIYRDNQVVVGNTHGSMALLDFRMGKLVHVFKGFAGSIRSIKCHATEPVVASCGLDRFFRVHDINTRELTHKKYMKSRLNCLLLSKHKWIKDATKDVENAVEVTEDTNHESNSKDSEDEEEVWNQMEVVKTRTVKRKDLNEDQIIEKKQKISTKEKVKSKKTRKVKKVK